jgi:hypothetical protein
MRIVIVFFKYNTFYFTYPPRKRDFSHILPSCSLLIAESRKYHPVVVLLLITNDQRRFLASFKEFRSILCPSIFRQIAAICNASPLLCPINATSSSSYVYRLQYPRVLHCRIVPIEKWETLIPIQRTKHPM